MFVWPTTTFDLYGKQGGRFVTMPRRERKSVLLLRHDVLTADAVSSVAAVR